MIIKTNSVCEWSTCSVASLEGEVRPGCRASFPFCFFLLSASGIRLTDGTRHICSVGDTHTHQNTPTLFLFTKRQQNEQNRRTQFPFIVCQVHLFVSFFLMLLIFQDEHKYFKCWPPQHKEHSNSCGIKKVKN